MKKIFMLFFIIASASILSAEEIEKEEEETPALQVEEYEHKTEKDEIDRHEIYEFPITLGMFSLFDRNDFNICTFAELFYPPLSAAVINYDSKFNFGSVYEFAENYTFTGNSFLGAGLHLKVNMDLYYNSPSLGGGFGSGLFLLLDDTIMLKAGGRAAFYKKILYAGPEAAINFISDDFASFNCSYCYGFTTDHKKLWRASCILSFSTK